MVIGRIPRHIAADLRETDMAQTDPWDETAEPKELKGIGGWLWLPLLQLVWTLIMIVVATVGRLKAHPPAAVIHDTAGHPIFLMLAVVAAAVMLAQLLLGLFCLVRFLQQRAELPRLMTIWYGIGIALCVLVPIQFALDQDVFAKAIDVTATSSGLGFRSTFIIAMCGLLILYFDVSKRVKNTFVR
jgi:hypothetical protein